jgi:hypothetical protein
MKLSHEPAIVATVTAGLATAAGVGAALNAVDLPGGWDWLETWLPIIVFVAYIVTGLVIRPFVTPTAKLGAGEHRAGPSNVHLVAGNERTWTATTGDPVARADAATREQDPLT